MYIEVISGRRFINADMIVSIDDLASKRCMTAWASAAARVFES
jgi:hypothetical protein